MQQGFNVELATQYGIKEAIIFAIIRRYCVDNGNQIACIPLRLLAKRAPYISKGSMKRIIANLDRANLIRKRKGFDDLLGLGNFYEITEYGKKFT